MARHLNKAFSDQQVRALLGRYVGQEIRLEHIIGVLKIGRSWFFEILKDYRADPRGFTVAYQRKSCPRKLAPEIEKNIVRELRFEKRLIENLEVPLRGYNYSYVRDRLSMGTKKCTTYGKVKVYHPASWKSSHIEAPVASSPPCLAY